MLKKGLKKEEPEVTELVIMKPQALLPMSKEGIKRFHQNQRHTWGKQLIFKSLPVLRIPYYEIDSTEKIIHYIRQEYGWLIKEYDNEHPEKIIYNVFFRGQRRNIKRNNKPRKVIQYYDPTFICDGENCRYFGHCRIKHLFKKGWSCAKNPKFIWVWILRLKFILKRIPTKEPPYDYKYTILRDSTSRLKWIKQAKIQKRKYVEELEEYIIDEESEKTYDYTNRETEY